MAEVIVGSVIVLGAAVRVAHRHTARLAMIWLLLAGCLAAVSYFAIRLLDAVTADTTESIPSRPISIVMVSASHFALSDRRWQPRQQPG